MLNIVAKGIKNDRKTVMCRKDYLNFLCLQSQSALVYKVAAQVRLHYFMKLLKGFAKRNDK